MVPETDLQISRAENRQAKQALNVGLIGTGRISDIYLKTCSSFSELNIKVFGSLNLHQSSEKASRYGISEIASPDEIIADESIDCILNLTLPAVHAEVGLAALAAVQHVYSEKPFATCSAECCGLPAGRGGLCPCQGAGIRYDLVPVACFRLLRRGATDDTICYVENR